jgi:hypothetical protein
MLKRRHFFFQLCLQLGLLLFSSLIALFLLEKYLSVSGYKKQLLTWNWVSERHLHVYDKDLIYKVNKNISIPELDVQTDEQGFRSDPNIKRSSSTSSADTIVVVGDSFVWGNTQYKDTYPFLLQESLASFSAQPIKVINAGVSGYGTDQEYKSLKTYLIPSLHPKTIVWNININDIQDSIAQPLYDFQKGHLIPIAGWKNHIYLEGLASQLLNYSFIKDRLITNLFLDSLDKTHLFHISATPDHEEEWALEKMKYLFADIEKECREKNITLLFVIDPSQRLVEKLPSWEKEQHKFELIKNEINPNLTTLDINTAFEKNASSSASFFLDESAWNEKGFWHPNALGNSIMATEVKDQLITH